MPIPAIRNPAWSEHRGTYSADASDLRSQRDPWNRQLPEMTKHRDSDGDITHWTATTTVDGQPVQLTIFND